MIAGNPFENARRLSKSGESAVRPLQIRIDRSEIVGDLFGTLHSPAFIGERFLFAGFGGQSGQFADGMLQPFTVARGRLDLRARVSKLRLRSPERCPGACGITGIDPAEGIEQNPMAT